MVSCALQKHLGGVLGALCQDCARAYAKQEATKLTAEVKQLRVQLAGCLVAAEGDKSETVQQGVYGWSVAFEAVRTLRAEHDALFAAARASIVSKAVGVSQCKICGHTWLSSNSPQHYEGCPVAHPDVQRLLKAPHDT